MSSEDKKPDKKKGRPESGDKNVLTLPEMGRALSDRWKLSSRYHSGELDLLRSVQTKIAEVPWRILRYQRILRPDDAFLPVSQFAYVTPGTFERQLKQLSKECRIVPIEELVREIKSGEEIPEKTVAITIDGGYMDSFLYAFPVIRELEIPVAMFLPTYFIGTYDLFWSDKALLGLMSMRNRGMTIEPFDFFSQEIKDTFAEVSPDGEANLPAIAVMIAGLKEAEPSLRQLGIAAIGAIHTDNEGVIPAEPSFLSWEEVKIMEQFGVRFGSLGHHHRPFHEIVADIALKEVERTFKALAEHLEAPLRMIAPPEGVLSLELVKILKEMDISGCLLADHTPDHLVFEESVYALRRVTIYEGMTRSPELFFCKLWDIPYDVKA